jgi:transcriptional regulator with XRE-family HTH domain
LLQLRTLRTQAGLSAEKLAHQAGLSMHTVLRIEQGRAKPLWETVQKLATALNVSPEQLTEQAAPPHDVGQEGEHRVGTIGPLSEKALAGIVNDDWYRIKGEL